jgi:hypothetical protein
LFHAIIVSILDVLFTFTSSFISFFGTNLLTQCPMPVAVLVFQNISTKRSPNATKLFGDFLLDTKDPGSFGRRPEDVALAHKAPGRAGGGRRALVAYGAHIALFDLIPPL